MCTGECIMLIALIISTCILNVIHKQDSVHTVPLKENKSKIYGDKHAPTDNTLIIENVILLTLKTITSKQTSISLNAQL